MAPGAPESPEVRGSRELLGTPRGASTEDLKRAFRKLAMLYHPDRRPDAPEAAREFDRVRKAFDLLSDSVRVGELNRAYSRERTLRPCVEGLDLCFGSFFGYRVFRLPSEGGDDLMVEESRSILDDPAFDALEVAFGGAHAPEDGARLQEGVQAPLLARLPWVVVNNQGLFDALDGRFERAFSRFEELDRRVPNNIAFLYRKAICRAILAFQRARPGLFGGLKPDRAEIDIAVADLRRCVEIGGSRAFGKQRCLTIRKAIAEILEKSGRSSEAKIEWRSVQALEPRSAEAAFRSEGPSAAMAVVDERIAKLAAARAPQALSGRSSEP